MERTSSSVDLAREHCDDDFRSDDQGQSLKTQPACCAVGVYSEHLRELGQYLLSRTLYDDTNIHDC